MKLIRTFRLLFLVTGLVLLLRLISIPARAADAGYNLIIYDGRVMDGSGHTVAAGPSATGPTLRSPIPTPRPADLIFLGPINIPWALQG